MTAEDAYMSKWFAPPDCEIRRRDDGSFLLVSQDALAPYPNSIIDVLREQAVRNPGRVLYREANFDGVIGQLTYAETLDLALRAGRVLLDLGASPERPVLMLAENSLMAAVIILGCHAASIPISPVSPAYSKAASDHSKLSHVLSLVTPSVIVLDDARLHASALDLLVGSEAYCVAFREAAEPVKDWRGLVDKVKKPALETSIDPDAVAKILFTSGSTGMPKGVITTHRMMCSNQIALASVWPGLHKKPPRLVDWLPWSHTYGGNCNFNMPIMNGGSLTIDQGKPTPDGAATMFRSLRRIQPNILMSVPRALTLILEELEREPTFAKVVLSKLELIGYAGAALPQTVWSRFRILARDVMGVEIPIVGLWGSTETAPTATAVHWDVDRHDCIGLPVPGTDLKFSPVDGKHELRVRGPNVTPGYWRDPEATAKAFDSEGFFRMGDAGRLVDITDPNSGVLFDGRVAENFKLATGTWVNVGILRVKIIEACGGLVSDAVIAGHNQNEICVLLFPHTAACVTLTGEVGYEVRDGTIANSNIQRSIENALAEHNCRTGGSSNRVARAIVLADAPSLTDGEITDKGYINQARVLELRSDLVKRLYKENFDSTVIVVGKSRDTGRRDNAPR